MSRSRTTSLFLLMLVAELARAGAGGPDAGDHIFADSAESDGPPVALLDLSSSTAWTLGSDELLELELPFPWSWYGTEQDRAWVSPHGALFFSLPSEHEGRSCPGSGTWSGVAPFWTELLASELRVATFGEHPYRVLALEWSGVGVHGVPGEGSFQLWFLEARQELVVTLEDIDFGTSEFDGGAGAVVGIAGGSGAGLAWSCEGGLSSGMSAWFGTQDARTAGQLLRSNSLEHAWEGTEAYAFAGRSLAEGDLNGDGLSELLVGDQNLDQGLAMLLYSGTEPGSLSLAQAILRGEEEGDEASASLAMGDLNGDGLHEIIMGAPNHAPALDASAGRVYVLEAGDLSGELRIDDVATLRIDGPTGSGKAHAGASVCVPGDVDGDGLDDLLFAAPEDDLGATNSGSVFLWTRGLLSGTRASALSEAVFVGSDAGDLLGQSLGGADLDGDGRAELLLGAPRDDASGVDAGRLFILAGADWSGTLDAEAEAIAWVEGESDGHLFGASFTLGELFEPGILDLFVGAPGADHRGASSGSAYLFEDLAARLGTLDSALATARVDGSESSDRLGEATVAGDIDGDGLDDLFLSAPNAGDEGVSSGGVVYAWRTAPRAEILAEDADHRVLGTSTSGALGSALAFIPSWDGDGYGDLAMGQPYADLGGSTLNGGLVLWDYHPSYEDQDRDGFVSTNAAGLDCDDSDPLIFPGAIELPSNGVDDDCDGWIDDALRVRSSLALWDWDLEELHGGPEFELFDFEDSGEGARLEELYLRRNLTMEGDGPLTAQTEVFGSLARGELAASFTPTGSNTLILTFGEGVELLSLYLLDGMDCFSVSGNSAEGLLFAGVPIEAFGEDRPGGRFLGMEFAEPIFQLAFFCDSGDGWGLDDLSIGWASFTDGDGDGFTEEDGDCDDRDASVHPDAREIYDNGLDDDCDGVIDGSGIETLMDLDEWLLAAGIETQLIDFEVPDPGEVLSEQYQEQGIVFEQDPYVDLDVDGAAPRGYHAALAREILTEDSIRLQFLEPQPALAFQVLDAQAPIELRATSVEGEELRGELVAEGNDLAEGVFVGLIFESPIVQIEILAGTDAEVFGLDDLLFSELGLDDADGDGLTEAEGDCDDADADVSPGAPDTWYDGVDSDCAGDDDYDADGDGFDLDEDCDDTSADINPDAPETWYDEVDQNCDGLSDYDADGDGWDLGEGEDCDDTDPEVSPDATETPYDGIDDNCYPEDEYDADGDGWSIPGGAVSGSEGEGDCDDSDAESWPGAEERWYDGVDQDCDGLSDFDQDGDSYELDLLGGEDCDDEDPSVHPGVEDPCYDGIDADCDGHSDYDCDRDGYDTIRFGGLDCDDTAPEIHPGAPDTPGDGIDADCDGRSDFDADSDGYESLTVGGLDCDDDDAAINPAATERCADGIDQDCDGQDDRDCDGDSYEALERGGLDCDDEDPEVHPGMIETCYDGVDADCTGGEEGDFDCDGDGHRSLDWGGDDCDDSDSSVHPSATDYPYDAIDQDCDGLSDFDQDLDGYPSALYGGDDCDDLDPAIHPGAEDACYDGLDQDCDGLDSDDCDEDGFSSMEFGGDDCDDLNASIHPGALDPCGDTIDADCDGSDSCTDLDGDGHEATSAGGDDCNDHNASVHPGATDLCGSGIDEDCDGMSEADCDEDGHESMEAGGGDCDDDDSTVHPGATERWYDGRDQDCDGRSDYDQDGDGFDARPWGGEDCDDTEPDVHPGVKVDGCGHGDEDCDGETDEDCEPVDTGDTEDSGDTGESGDTEDSGDTGESGDTQDTTADSDMGQEDSEEPPGTVFPNEEDKSGSCGGCSTSARLPSLGALLLTLALLLRRREGRGGR